MDHVEFVTRQALDDFHMFPHRFRIVQRRGKAIDEVRAEEAKRLERDGDEPVLGPSRPSGRVVGGLATTDP
ncbi:MAG: hypothetical protein AAGF11_55675 [Myxococcota bacterium]